MLATLIASIAAGETASVIERMKRSAVAYAIAGFAAFLAILFFIVAVYVWAAFRYGPIPAALGFAVVFAVCAVLTVVVHSVTNTRRKKRAAERRATDVKAIGITAAIAFLPALLARRGIAGLIVPAVGVLGYMIYKENARRAPPPPVTRRL